MKGAIMQAYFFPYLGYFQLIEQVDEFILYEHVSFRKKSWMTRNRLLKKGINTEFLINIPVLGSSSSKKISEIEICSRTNWRRDILNLLYYNYKHASFFDSVYYLVENIFKSQDNLLHNFNSLSVTMISRFIGIDTPIRSVNTDLIEIERCLSERCKQSGLNEKSQRIVDICKSKNYTHYINPEGGIKLYDTKVFQTHGIRLSFWISHLPSYTQFCPDFVHGLSILDALMHLGPSGVRGMLSCGRLESNTST